MIRSLVSERASHWFVIVMFMLLSAHAASGEPGQKEEPADARKNIVTKVIVYDVRDLLVQPPNFTDSPELKLRAADRTPTFHTIIIDDGAGHTSRGELIESLINLIQDIIGHQEHWRAYGGTLGSIVELNGNLVVSTTPANHKDLADLLKQLRSAKNIQIATDAMFLRIRSTTLEQLKDKHTRGSPVLSEKAAATLTAMALRGEDGIQIVGTVRQVGFNAQRVNTVGLNQPNVKAVGPKKILPRVLFHRTLDHGSKPTFDPTDPGVSSPNNQPKPTVEDKSSHSSGSNKKNKKSRNLKKHSNTRTGDVLGGAIVDVEPLLSADRKHIIMTIRSSIATVSTNKKDKNDKAGKQVLPQSHLTTLNTSARIPDKGGILVGAASHQLKDGQPDSDFELVLFLRARAVIAK